MLGLVHLAQSRPVFCALLGSVRQRDTWRAIQRQLFHHSAITDAMILFLECIRRPKRTRLTDALRLAWERGV